MLTLVWLRQDLRLADNPALAHAASRGKVAVVYILDDATPPAQWRIGGASRWWLHHSLARLDESLGGRLIRRSGDPIEIVPALAKALGAGAVCWNRCYEPYAITRDTRLKQALNGHGLDVQSFNGSLLHEPWEVRTGSDGPFKVFSPFWRACQVRAVDHPTPEPALDLVADPSSEPLAAWALLPTKPNWAAGWERLWQPGEAGARTRLERFLASGLQGYADLRNRPDLDNVSSLSPHLHFGEISPRQVWAATRHRAESGRGLRKDADKFLSEIGWREFAYHLLYQFPELPNANWRPAFDAYPWRSDASDLAAWQRGMTGYPMVDAGMRQLWATGWMHNRVRMIVASFLIKHLRIDWREGERWFWDTLLDADLASNAASWQWVAGSGADAAPYFRIFNPIEQGRKFDPLGAYVRKWCPEIAALPDEFVHAPFQAPALVLKAAGVTLGESYPEPIVDHTAARTLALAGYEAVKAATERAA